MTNYLRPYLRGGYWCDGGAHWTEQGIKWFEFREEIRNAIRVRCEACEYKAQKKKGPG